MTLTKTELTAGAGSGDFDDFYKNTCLSVVQNDGVTADHPKTTTLCTDQTYGFTGSDDNTANIVFTGALATLTDVVSAQLVFDSRAASGNSNGQTVGIAQLAMSTTP